MLNLVPIQFLALLGYTILRLTIGFTLLVLARSQWRERTTLLSAITFPLLTPRQALIYLIASEIITGLLFIAGAFTQVAALLTIVLALKLIIWRRSFAHPTIPPTTTLILLIGISLCLFITGAGFLAFDLPI